MSLAIRDMELKRIYFIAAPIRWLLLARQRTANEREDVEKRELSYKTD